MLKSGTCLLLTFTFTDKCLAKTTFETRKQKVRRFLSAHNCNYIANVDYGKQHNREHFHSIAQIDKVDFSLFNKYGALNGKVITKKNAKQLAKYIVKGTNKNIAINKKLMHLMYNRTLS